MSAATKTKSSIELPIPDWFPEKATGHGRRPWYQANPFIANLVGAPALARDGLLELGTKWRKAYNLSSARDDKKRALLMGIDYADTFGHSDAELQVPGAVEDSYRFSSFLMRNLKVITDTMLTFDSHFVPHVFHTPMWKEKGTGSYPPPFTAITVDNYQEFEPSDYAPYWVGKDRRYLEQYLAYYVAKLAEPRVFSINGENRDRPRDPLILWPLHAQMGSQGYTLFPEVEEAVMFHQFARGGRMVAQVKGLDKLTEAYSPFGSEVTVDFNGDPVGRDSEKIIHMILTYDVVIIGGEAASHCVRAGIYDILGRILLKDRSLAKKIYLLKDCMSAVPGFEAQATEALQDFKDAGMNAVASTDPIESWPGVIQEVIRSRLAA
ncbi:MAG TPA: hypothetical protein PKA63_06900 [Oligoflexia bacterium]|nr:hypothetical protein [Oligoflexia bacterium]HMP48378.1 hypothetical protein [Oligoflexia bacterium]